MPFNTALLNNLYNAWNRVTNDITLEPSQGCSFLSCVYEKPHSPVYWISLKWKKEIVNAKNILKLGPKCFPAIKKILSVVPAGYGDSALHCTEHCTVQLTNTLINVLCTKLLSGQ